MNKRNRRIFILSVKIKEDVWDYHCGQVVKTAVISNNKQNAVDSFENRHWGSEYPDYEVIEIYDTLEAEFFRPDLTSKNLI